MSAISTSNSTGPIPAAHRTDAPVWAFHLALAWAVWAVATVVYRVNAWETRFTTAHPRLVAATGATAVTLTVAALLAMVVFA